METDRRGAGIYKYSSNPRCPAATNGSRQQIMGVRLPRDHKRCNVHVAPAATNGSHQQIMGVRLPRDHK